MSQQPWISCESVACQTPGWWVGRSAPLHRATDADLARWATSDKTLVALVPELDDYLQPEEAKRRFAIIPHAEIIGVEGAKHLWVGESATSRVLNEIVKVVNPSAYPLPTHWPA
jgi:hypothetical protein